MKKIRVYLSSIEVIDILLMITLIIFSGFGKTDIVIALGFILLFKKFSG